ncbi:Hsp20/alpha crystallin family protein [Natrialbaceae archaeon A-arb3/5]
MADRSGPFDGIGELLDRLTRQIETAARTWESELDNRSRLDLSMGQSATNIDVADEDDEFVVTVDVPGYETDDLEIRLAGERLSITGERAQMADHETSEDNYIRRERAVQSFSRQVPLPAPVAVDEVEATVNNGILTIRLPKREDETESHSIDIE